MVILVTGGSGLIGSRIVREIVRGGNKAVIYDLVIDDETLNFVLTEEDKKNVEIVQGDILDYDKLVDTVKKYDVEKIVHTASMMGNADKPILSVHVNTGGMIRILEIARTMPQIKKVVYTSTNSIFAVDDTGLILNDARPRPDGLYGCTKTFNEVTADMYYREYGVDITGIRVSAMVFGALQRRGVSGSTAIEAVYKPAVGEAGHVLYDDTWAWLYVDEVAYAHMLALDLERKEGMAGAYNLKGTVIKMEDLINFVRKTVPGAQIQMDHGTRNLHNWNLDMTVTEKELGYKQQKDVWEAWKETINQQREAAGLEAL